MAKAELEWKEDQGLRLMKETAQQALASVSQ